MRFAMWSLYLALRDFATMNTVANVTKNRSLKTSTLLSYFRLSGKRSFFFLSVNRDPLFIRFVNRARDAPCMTLLSYVFLAMTSF